MAVLEVRYYLVECDDCDARDDQRTTILVTHPGSDEKLNECDLARLLKNITSDGWHVERKRDTNEIKLVLCPACVAARYAQAEREAYAVWEQEHA